MDSAEVLNKYKIKKDELIEEKIEYLSNLMSLYPLLGTIFDEKSLNKIGEFTKELIEEASWEQDVINKIYDFLVAYLSLKTADELNAEPILESLIELIPLLEEKEDRRTEEYYNYLANLGYYIERNMKVTASLLPKQRKNQEKSELFYKKIYDQIPVITAKK